jgi:hypothetical protein
MTNPDPDGVSPRVFRKLKRSARLVVAGYRLLGFPDPLVRAFAVEGAGHAAARRVEAGASFDAASRVLAASVTAIDEALQSDPKPPGAPFVGYG